MFPFQATRIPRFRALCWRGSEGIAAAPVIAAAVFPEFVARCTAAVVPGLAEGRARKPQPEAQRRDRVRTRAQRCPAPASAKAKSPDKARNSGKTAIQGSTRPGPQPTAARRAPLGRRPLTGGQRPRKRSDNRRAARWPRSATADPQGHTAGPSGRARTAGVEP